MKKTMILTLALAASGCAVKGHYQAYEGALRPETDHARVLVPQPGNQLTGLLFGSTQVRISCVDGKSTGKFFGYNTVSVYSSAPEVLVAPGRHNLTMTFTGGHFTGQQTVWFEAEAGRTYYVRHEVHGSGYNSRGLHVQVQEKESGRLISRVMNKQDEPQDAEVPKEQRCRA